ncbi:transposase [Streptomyces sp. NPDC005533]|uniref:transposase n=1 Tax=Streptomyces sp. NPDC005533 TaxID=3364723 RepID=UPI0036D1D37C
MKRPKYTPEFREEAVQLALKSSKSISEVAREIGVSPETLRTWVRRYEREHGRQGGTFSTDERARLKEQDRRIRELEMENVFLKKSAAYFARDPR